VVLVVMLQLILTALENRFTPKRPKAMKNAGPAVTALTDERHQ
jgi:hypothetical protein